VDNRKTDFIFIDFLYNFLRGGESLKIITIAEKAFFFKEIIDTIGWFGL
jgi:hypothetical protein